MFRHSLPKSLLLLAVTLLLTLSAVTPAAAAETRQGDHIVIAAGEVVADDLYVMADTFTLDGTVEGDLIVFASLITINGTVEGDLMAAAQTIVVNGHIADDARLAGAVIFLGPEARLDGDLMSGCSSLETRPGSVIGGDLMSGSNQALLAGEVGGDAVIGANGLEVRGAIGGDLTAEVGEASGEYGYFPPMPNLSVTIPAIRPGLTLDPEARIAGDLTYSQSADLAIPAGVVAGAVTRRAPAIEQPQGERFPIETRQPTTAEKIGDWFLGLLHRSVTLILVGLLLAWAAPRLVPGLGRKIESRPLHSLGWGVVAWAAFWFALLVVLFAALFLTFFFAALTLGGLAAAAAILGLLLLIELVVAFVLVTSWLTFIVIGTLIGRLILNAIRPGLGEHRIWPLLLGVLLIAIVTEAPFIGGLIGLLVVLFGLGALWLQGSETLRAHKSA